MKLFNVHRVPKSYIFLIHTTDTFYSMHLSIFFQTVGKGGMISMGN